MNTRPLVRRTVRLVTLGALVLLLAGPAVSAASTGGWATASGAGPIAPGPAAHPLPNRQARSAGFLAATGQPATNPTGPGLHDTHTVTSTADSGPGSLRRALFDASPGDTIDFALAYPATITLTGGELGITKSLTILGPGAENLAVSGNGASRVLAISGASTTLALSGLTVADGADSAGGGIVSEGTLTVTHTTFSGNYAFYFGGGIYNWGPLTVVDATFSDNWAQGGGGIWSARPVTLTDVTFSGNGAYNGGGILNEGTLVVTNATFSGNEARTGGGVENRGTLTVSDTAFYSNTANYGGGIYNNLGPLTVVNSTFFGNTVNEGGGGIENGGMLTLTNTTFSGNEADWGGDGRGGGIENGGVLMLTHATFSGNHAGYGGGISNEGTMTVIDATFSGNGVLGSGYGGGIYNTRGLLTVTHATFSGNTAGYWGGGIYNDYLGTLAMVDTTLSGNGASSAGGIGNCNGTLTVVNSTLSGNTADYWGGGILNWWGTLMVTSATLSGNAATNETGGGIYNFDGTLRLRSTIVANSTAGGDCDNQGTIGQNVANLIEDGSCSPQYSGDPNLGPLGDYGGDTWTHPLLYPSQAIDHGDPATCPATDQRGYPRNGPCDIGAFELACIPADGAGFFWLPITPTVGQAVTLTGTVAAGNEPISYTWKLEVGSWKEGRVVTHTYGLPGAYTVVMTATNCATATATASHTFTVVCPDVTAAGFAWTPAAPEVGQAVTFTAAASSTRPLTYAWDLGDGTVGSGITGTHVYSPAGNYLVTLTATNDCGAWQAVTDTVVVTCQEVSIVSVTTVLSGCAVTFGAELAGTPPFTYLWDFGPFGTSTATNPLVDFGAGGTYSGALSVWNCGNTAPATGPFAVEVACAREHFIYLPIVVKS